MKPYQNILVGIDYSQSSRSALRAAIRLGAFNNAVITAVHILDPALAAALKRVNGFSDEQMIKVTEDSVHRFLVETEVGTESVRVRIETGHPVAGLVGACRDLDADLLVLGTHGNHHLGYQVGPVAAKCTRKTPCDVLLIREGQSGPFRKALVGIDLSETSREAFKAALQVAECDGTALHCLLVQETPAVAGAEYGGYLPGLSLVEWSDGRALEGELATFLMDAASGHPEVHWISTVEESFSARATLLRHATDDSCDLVVVGTKGTSNLLSLVMGTTAENIVAHAPASLLAVKPPYLNHVAQHEWHIP
ncbi:MAG: universal stress protein [Verrucomicrobium sp.]|nr:universal stress protein [Verrucomicrobium sp.]